MPTNNLFKRIAAGALAVFTAALFSCAPFKSSPEARPETAASADETTADIAVLAQADTADAAASVTVAPQTSGGGTPTETETAMPETDAVTADSTATKPGFITVPRFFGLTENEAVAYLAGYGITAAAEYEYGWDAKGKVFSVVFHGSWDNDNLYVQSGSAVTLKVSLGINPAEIKKAVPRDAAGGKIAYLTFDDGPTKENTYKILDILDTYGVKATFFVVGSSAARYKAQLKEIYAAGETIGCHSYCHVYDSIYTSSDMFLADFNRWKETVSAVLGSDYSCALYRFPAGSAYARKYDSFNAIRTALGKLDLRAFDWTMSNNDVWSGSKAGSLTAVEYEKNCFKEQLDRLDAGGKLPVIILMHETHSSTVEMLPWAIELLIDKGYAFDTLDNYSGDYYQ